MEFIRLFIPAFVACTCNALANMLWKMRFDKIPLKLDSIKNILDLIVSPHIWGGVICYGGSMLLFFYMLSNFRLSAIMPVTCMTYIFNIIIARVVFGETISRTQILGTAIIIFGLIILSRVPVNTSV
jgi:drug/metabolite transporter (DMT)-like permease